MSCRSRHPQGLQGLGGQLCAKGLKVFKGNPVNAIHRTGVDGFLDPFGGVPVLTDRSGTAVIGFDHKGVAGHVSAVSASDADRFIHPDGLITQLTPEQWLSAIRRGWTVGRSRECLRRVYGVQASQRVTTSSMAPSTVTVCSATSNPSRLVAARTVFRA